MAFLRARLYRIWPGNGIGVQARAPIAQNDWQHIAVTYDGSSTAAGLRIFLNGHPLETDTIRDHMQKKASPALFGTGHLTLGQRFRDRGFKDGDLDELRIYDRALSPLEIANLHDGKSLAAALSDPNNLTSPISRSFYFSAIDDEARNAMKALRDDRRRFVEVEESIQEIPVMEETLHNRDQPSSSRGTLRRAEVRC